MCPEDDDSVPDAPSVAHNDGIRLVADTTNSALVQELNEKLASAHSAMVRAEYIERDLRQRLSDANARIAFLEEEPEPLPGTPTAPPWVQGSLLRALIRVQNVFARIADLDDKIERFEDSLNSAQQFCDNVGVLGDSAQDMYLRLAMLADMHERIREVLDSAVAIEELRSFAAEINAAEDDVQWALALRTDSPLQLSLKSRVVRI